MKIRALAAGAVIAVALAGAAACAGAPGTAGHHVAGSETSAQITDARSAIAAGKKIVDVRTPEEYAGEHVKGAVHLELSAILSGFPEVAQVLPGKDETFVVYCRSGNRSAHAVRALERMGYVNAIDGGGRRDDAGAGAVITRQG